MFCVVIALCSGSRNAIIITTFATLRPCFASMVATVYKTRGASPFATSELSDMNFARSGSLSIICLVSSNFPSFSRQIIALARTSTSRMFTLSSNFTSAVVMASFLSDTVFNRAIQCFVLFQNRLYKLFTIARGENNSNLVA